MRTIALLLLLLPAIALAQQPPLRVVDPFTIDPAEVYIFKRPQGFFKTADGRSVCVGIFQVKRTGEYVRIATSSQTCELNENCEVTFEPAPLPTLP